MTLWTSNKGENFIFIAKDQVEFWSSYSSVAEDSSLLDLLCCVTRWVVSSLLKEHTTFETTTGPVMQHHIPEDLNLQGSNSCWFHKEIMWDQNHAWFSGISVAVVCISGISVAVVCISGMSVAVVCISGMSVAVVCISLLHLSSSPPTIISFLCRSTALSLFTMQTVWRNSLNYFHRSVFRLSTRAVITPHHVINMTLTELS